MKTVGADERNTYAFPTKNSTCQYLLDFRPVRYRYRKHRVVPHAPKPIAYTLAPTFGTRVYCFNRRAPGSSTTDGRCAAVFRRHRSSSSSPSPSTLVAATGVFAGPVRAAALVTRTHHRGVYARNTYATLMSV